MKAIHKKTGSVNEIIEVWGDSLELLNLYTNNTRILSMDLFKENFEMVDEDEVGEIPELQDSEDIIAEGNKDNVKKNKRVITIRETKKTRKPKTKKYWSSSHQQKEIQRNSKPKKKPIQPSESDGKEGGKLMALKELTDNPSKARAKLRKAGWEKPYLFNEDEIQEVMKIID